MCQVNNEREINILGEEEDQIGRDPIRWRRRRKEKEKEKKEERQEKEKEKEKQKGGRVRESERKKRRREEKKRKGNNTSLRDFRRTDGRNASGQETKLVHTTRAMHGYRNPSFSSKLQEVGVFSYTGSFLFKSRKWPCGSA